MASRTEHHETLRRIALPSPEDGTRLTIVHEPARGDRPIMCPTARLGLAQSTVSAHVACLRDCGLVEDRAAGRPMLYRLTRPEALTLLAAAEQVLAATGRAVALCPDYGDDTAPVRVAAVSA